MWARLREIVFGNLGLKLASLVLALLLYAHVVTDQPRESIVQIPLTLTGLSDTLAVMGRPPERVGVKIRGKWKDLIRLGLTSPYLAVDLAQAAPGPFRTTITAEDVAQKGLPPELAKLVAVTEVVEPRTVELTIEPKRARLVRVAPRVTGTLLAGVRIESIRVLPESVRVQGPATILASLDSLSTLPIDITGEREKIQRQVDVDPHAARLSIEPRRCLVTIRLGPAGAGDAAVPR